MPTKSAADVCRERGWQAGDVLQRQKTGVAPGDFLQITAIGTVHVLVRVAVGNNWTADCAAAKNWFYKKQKIAHAPLDDTPPKPEWFA